MKTLTFAGMLLLLVAHAALASDPQREALATKVVQLSGVENSLAALPQTLKAQSDISKLAQLAGEEKSDSDALSSFDPEAAKERLIKYIAGNSDAVTLSKTVAWLESPLGRKMTDAEGAERGLEFQYGQLKFLNELKQNPPVEERIMLMRRFVKASGQLEMVSKVFEATAVRIAVAMANGNDEVAVFARAKVKEAWAPLEKQFMQQLSLADLYMYRNIPDPEMRAYTDFLESDAGKRYTAVFLEGYGQILEDLVLESQKSLIEGYKKQMKAQDQDEE